MEDRSQEEFKFCRESFHDPKSIPTLGPCLSSNLSYDENSDSWKLVPCTDVVRVGGSSQDLLLSPAFVPDWLDSLRGLFPVSDFESAEFDRIAIFLSPADLANSISSVVADGVRFWKSR
jgi:hypothetical protein